MPTDIRVRIDEETHQKLRKIAFEKEMSINTIIKLAINQWLRDNTDYEK